MISGEHVFTSWVSYCRWLHGLGVYIEMEWLAEPCIGYFDILGNWRLRPSLNILIERNKTRALEGLSTGPYWYVSRRSFRELLSALTCTQMYRYRWQGTVMIV